MAAGGIGLMRFAAGALLTLGVLSAAPAFAQASPSSYTTGYRYDADRRLGHDGNGDGDLGPICPMGAQSGTGTTSSTTSSVSTSTSTSATPSTTSASSASTTQTGTASPMLQPIC